MDIVGKNCRIAYIIFELLRQWIQRKIGRYGSGDKKGMSLQSKL